MTLAMYIEPIGLFYTIPAVVTIHRIISTTNGRYTTVGFCQLARTVVELSQDDIGIAQVVNIAALLWPRARGLFEFEAKRRRFPQVAKVSHICGQDLAAIDHVEIDDAQATDRGSQDPALVVFQARDIGDGIGGRLRIRPKAESHGVGQGQGGAAAHGLDGAGPFPGSGGLARSRSSSGAAVAFRTFGGQRNSTFSLISIGAVWWLIPIVKRGMCYSLWLAR